MEFLIDTGMELARHIILKIFDHIQDEASKCAADKSTNKRVIRDWLQPQLDKLENEIKDLSEGTYKTALSHIHHAFVIMKERYNTLNQFDYPIDRGIDSDGKNAGLYIHPYTQAGHASHAGHTYAHSSPAGHAERHGGQAVMAEWRGDDHGLPQVVVSLLNMAYDKAYSSFNFTSNLSPEKRITAMQVAVLCIGLQHVNEPRITLARWTKCYQDVLQDPVILKAVEKNLENTQKFFRYFYGLKSRDLNAMVTFSQDLLRHVSRIASRDEVDKPTVNQLIETIVFPKEITSELQDVWAEKLAWKDHVNSCTFREEIQLKDAGAAFDACAALPDGGVVFALGNDALVQYDRDLKRTNFKAGSFYALTYDPSRNCLWGFCKRKGNLTQISMESLEPTGVDIPTPKMSSTLRVTRWHIAVTKTGYLIVAAQFMREADARGAKPFLFVRKSDSEDDNWLKLSYECDVNGCSGSKIIDLAAQEHGASAELLAIQIVISTEKGDLFLLSARVSGDFAAVLEVRV